MAVIAAPRPQKVNRSAAASLSLLLLAPRRRVRRIEPVLARPGFRKSSWLLRRLSARERKSFEVGGGPKLPLRVTCWKYRGASFNFPPCQNPRPRDSRIVAQLGNPYFDIFHPPRHCMAFASS